MGSFKEAGCMLLLVLPNGLSFGVDPDAIDWMGDINDRSLSQYPIKRLEMAIELSSDAMVAGQAIFSTLTGKEIPQTLTVIGGGKVRERLGENMFPPRGLEIFPSALVVGDLEIQKILRTKDGYLVALANHIHHSIIHPQEVFQRPDQPTWITEGVAVALETSFFPILDKMPFNAMNSLLKELMISARIRAGFPRDMLKTHHIALMRMVKDGLWFRPESFDILDQHVPYGDSPLWFDGGSGNRQYYERPGYFQAAVAFMFMLSDLYDDNRGLIDYMELPKPSGRISDLSPHQRVVKWNDAVSDLGLITPVGYQSYSRYCLQRSWEYCSDLSIEQVKKVPGF